MKLSSQEESSIDIDEVKFSVFDELTNIEIEDSKKIEKRQNFSSILYENSIIKDFKEDAISALHNGKSLVIKGPKDCGYERLVQVIHNDLAKEKSIVLYMEAFTGEKALLDFLITRFYDITKAEKKDRIGLSNVDRTVLFTHIKEKYTDFDATIYFKMPIKSELDRYKKQALELLFELEETTKLKVIFSIEENLKSSVLQRRLNLQFEVMIFPKFSQHEAISYIKELIDYEKTFRVSEPVINEQFETNEKYLKKLAKVSTGYVGMILKKAKENPADILNVSSFNWSALEDKNEIKIAIVEHRWLTIISLSFFSIAKVVYQANNNTDMTILASPFAMISLLLLFVLRFMKTDKDAKKT